jgi:hypothetical protein
MEEEEEEEEGGRRRRKASDYHFSLFCTVLSRFTTIFDVIRINSEEG